MILIAKNDEFVFFCPIFVKRNCSLLINSTFLAILVAENKGVYYEKNVFFFTDFFVSLLDSQ